MRVDTDVLVIGAGGAGMYAAIEAARAGAVFLIDRSLIGRGGATVMAQMTVAVALGAETPDDWRHHSRIRSRPAAGCATSALARLLCEDGPDCIREMEPGASAGRARTDASRRRSRPDTTGRAASMSISSTPARRCRRPCARASQTGIRAAGDLWSSTWSWRRRGGRRGRLHLATGEPVVDRGQGDDPRDRRPDPALPPQQRLRQHGRRRLCARAARRRPLIDMEFVQFFPIGHLAPRLIGMDPIMWDPFRYKLGGRLLNGNGRGVRRSATASRRTASTAHARRRHLRASSRRSRPGAARRTAASI